MKVGRHIKQRQQWLQSKYLSPAARKFRDVDEQSRKNHALRIGNDIKLVIMDSK